MKLSLQERFAVLNILPKEGNFATLKLVRNLQESMSPGEDEWKEFNIRLDNDQVLWDSTKPTEKEIEVGLKASELVKDALLELEKAKKLTANDLTIYEKFVETKEE